MNYYSRNSPVKNRHKKIPGFLLEFNPNTARRAKRQQQTSTVSHVHRSLNSSRQDESSIPTCAQTHTNMILIEDDSSSTGNMHEILIFDSQSQELPETDVGLASGIVMQNQHQQLASDRHRKEEEVAQNVREAVSVGREDGDSLANQQPVHIQEQHDARQFPRNFSFGSRNEVWGSAGSASSTGITSPDSPPAPPVIRRLFAANALANIYTSSQPREIKRIKSNNQMEGRKQCASPTNQENWHNYMKLFMRKRSSNLKSGMGSEEISEKEESETGQVFSDCYGGKKEHLSDESGYFNINGQSQSGQEDDGSQACQYDKPQASQHLLNRSGNHEVENGQDSHSHQTANSPQQPTTTLHHSQRIARHKPQHCISFTQQTPAIADYRQTLRMLSETLSQLPIKLIEPYLKLHNQLIHREHRARIIQQKQHETMNMLGLLLQMRKNQVPTDDYVLSDYSSSEEQQIQANKAIICSLVSKLAQKLTNF